MRINTRMNVISAKKKSPKSMSPLDELLVDGFDKEQIWEMIQLQNKPMLKYLEKNVDVLLENPDSIQLIKGDFEGNLKAKGKVSFRLLSIPTILGKQIQRHNRRRIRRRRRRFSE
jgi:hypothetical protein